MVIGFRIKGKINEVRFQAEDTAALGSEQSFAAGA